MAADANDADDDDANLLPCVGLQCISGVLALIYPYLE